MKTISLLYDSPASLQCLLLTGKLSADKPYLLRFYTAARGRSEAPQAAQQILALLPHAQFIGCSASGVIYENRQYPERDLLLVDDFETAQVHTGTFCCAGKPPQSVAQEIAALLTDSKARLAHILCGDHCPGVHDIIAQLCELCPQVKLVGGVAGDVLCKDEIGFVFDADGVIADGILVAALSGETLFTYAQANVAHEPISPLYTLTETEGGVWNSIEGVPAVSWICEQLGVGAPKSYESWQGIADNDILVRFPMILEGHHGASRFLQYDEKTNQISQYFTAVPLGTQFRIGYVNPSECVKQGFSICNDLMENPVESLFTYSCLFRRLFLNNCTQWELRPYKDYGMCGAFMMGEICCLQGYNEFLNGACCILAVAENEVYIRPDISEFERLENIEDDTRDLLNVVLKKQSESMNRYNEQLLEKLMSQQISSRQQLFVDFATGIPNYLQYQEDVHTHTFNKMCMVKIENSDVLLTHLGHDAYLDRIRTAVHMVQATLATMSEHPLLSCYAFSENTFFVAADELVGKNHFVELAHRLFEKFQFLRLDTGEVLLNRFVVVLNETDLIESALNAFQANRNIQAPFLVCEKNAQSRMSAHDELQMIGVLNRALENDGVVPYFQGVYDNVLKCITKYEALMRIVDLDGTVYTPAGFMSLAKKYHLYHPLSSIMVEKVLHLFAGRKESVSLNLSVYDIHSEEMQALFFRLLESIGDAHNIVIEVLEDEEFRDIELLKQFIVRAKQHGVKIAIDDFGAGYSNLLEIGSINPDYIKVDGGIIRRIDSDEMHRKIIDIIVLIGQQLNTDIIAEFVENAKIQQLVQDKGIRYSQGYYFAKPVPFAALGLDAELQTED